VSIEPPSDIEVIEQLDYREHSADLSWQTFEGNVPDVFVLAEKVCFESL